MVKQAFIKVIPLAATVAAALMLGGIAQAQTSLSNPGVAATPGTTNKKDNVLPEPSAGTGATGRAGASENKGAGAGANLGATATPGTTNKRDNVSPEPSAGRSPNSSTTVVPGTTDLTPAAPNRTGISGTTNKRDNVSPEPKAGRDMDDNARKQSRDNKKSNKQSNREMPSSGSNPPTRGSAAAGSDTVTPSR